MQKKRADLIAQQTVDLGDLATELMHLREIRANLGMNRVTRLLLLLRRLFDWKVSELSNRPGQGVSALNM